MQDDIIMRNFQYKFGLNKDTIKFNPYGECCAGGLYFSNEKYISLFDNGTYGSNIYEIKLPDAQIYLEDYDKAKADVNCC